MGEQRTQELAVSEPESQKREVPSKLLFHWIKSRFFRVVHADGAFGGISSRGYLHFSLYNERAAIPRLSERDLTVHADGKVTAGRERVVEGREGVVREIEIEVLMDHRSAVEFFNWLKEKIDILETMQEEQKNDDKRSK